MRLSCGHSTNIGSDRTFRIAAETFTSVKYSGFNLKENSA
jgi:hypothetical protein